MWARVFMADLAVAEGLGGEMALYDIDIPAAERNAAIGGYINADHAAKSRFEYKVYKDLDGALAGADFVVISILPGTFKEMRSDVHAPEKYGIYQSVGDTAGPGRRAPRNAHRAALRRLRPQNRSRFARTRG